MHYLYMCMNHVPFLLNLLQQVVVCLLSEHYSLKMHDLKQENAVAEDIHLGGLWLWRDRDVLISKHTSCPSLLDHIGRADIKCFGKKLGPFA